MSQTRWSIRVALGAWVTAAAAVLGSSACSVNSTQIADVDLPDRQQFITSVSPFMEQRCGALDCHGQIGRPMRIFSQNGLRKKDGAKGARDTRVTQPDELLANYFAVVGLEPEDVTAAKRTNGDFTDFLLLKKPLGIDQGGVRHKGGSVLRSTDPGFECLITWLSGQVNAQKCQEGLLP